jgi:hypothetical protein
MSVNKFGAKIVPLMDEEAKKLPGARKLMDFQFRLQVAPICAQLAKDLDFSGQ